MAAADEVSHEEMEKNHVLKNTNLLRETPADNEVGNVGGFHGCQNEDE